MSRILLVSEDELTELSHTSKLDVLASLTAAREASPEADFDTLLLMVQAQVLTGDSGYDPYADYRAEEPVLALEPEPEGVSFYEATADDSLVYEKEPQEEEEVVYTEPVYAPEDGVAYTEFDHATDQAHEEPVVEEQALEQYNTPVFPRDINQQSDPNFRIDRRRLAREVAQIDVDDE